MWEGSEGIFTDTYSRTYSLSVTLTKLYMPGPKSCISLIKAPSTANDSVSAQKERK